MQCLKDFKDIQKVDLDEEVSKLERKNIGRWQERLLGKPIVLGQIWALWPCRCQKNNAATISDLRDFNRILKKVRGRDSKLKFERIGEREDLIIVGIGDTSFKTDDKAVGGVFLFLIYDKSCAYLLEG